MTDPRSTRWSRRRALTALAASFAAVVPVAGCAPGDDPDGRTPVSLWFAYGGKNREELLALVEAFHAVQDHVRIRATYQGEYFETLAKVRTAMAVGAAPDLTHVIGEVVPYLADAGVLTPFDDRVPADRFDLVPQLSQDGGFVGGRDRPLVALPFNRSTPIAYLNGSVLDALGLAPPTTWEELRRFAARATERAADGAVTRWGFVCPIDFWFWAALVGQAGGEVIASDGRVALGDAAGVEAIRLWQTLVHEDRTMKPPPGRDYNAWQAANGDFLAGRAAMIWTSTAFLRYLEDNAKFRVVAAPLPAHARRAVPIGGTMFVMPKGRPPRVEQAAFSFLRWMMEPAQANRWATRTGYIPVSKPGLEQLKNEGFYRAHPNDIVAVDQLGAAMAWPWAPTLFRVQREAVQPRLEEAVLLQRDAGDVLNEARRAAAEP